MSERSKRRRRRKNGMERTTTHFICTAKYLPLRAALIFFFGGLNHCVSVERDYGIFSLWHLRCCATARPMLLYGVANECDFNSGDLLSCAEMDKLRTDSHKHLLNNLCVRFICFCLRPDTHTRTHTQRSTTDVHSTSARYGGTARCQCWYLFCDC